MSSLLRKRFDASKCKTLLQLTLQRLKVLRNKQALALKKARVDVAKLLEKGQDSNAKMQVEAVFREAKIVALYDMLEQFCQVVINGLESMKSQKECPLDLREAVASLVFAAPKCAELEELKQVSKHFASKYGTEFCIAAKELRPDSGVNKQIIQSLSSRPLDFDARLKLLKEIAVENNINWDYEMASADVSKGATDLIDGPNHFASATELSQVGTNVIADKQESRSMHVMEVKGQGNAVLQSVIGSRTMSAANSVGSPCHDVHQFAKINTNTGAMGSSRAQMVSDGANHTPVLDPYALARAEGKMDYKVVSDYKEKAQIMELKQESRGDVAHEKPAAQLPAREQGRNVLLDASHHEDALQRSKGRLSKKRLDVHRRNEEEELLALKNAAEYAFSSATHAAEAARAAVHMVRMESLERSKGSKAVNTKVQETQSEWSSGSVREENYKLAGMDFKRAADRERFFCEEEVDSEPHRNNGMVGDQVSETTTRSTLDASEDSFKYVVFEQTSGSQKYTQSSTQAEGYDMKAESYAFPEVWSEPTLYSRKNSERIIFDAEHEESGIKEMPTNALFDSFHSDNTKERELDKKVSFGNNQERSYYHTEVHEDKYVQNDLSVPQFDDYSSEEDDYVQKDLLVPQFEDSNNQERSYYHHQDKYVQNDLSVPQFDDQSSEEDDYVQKDLSGPQFEDHNSEEANEEEEEPFYLRGRAAMATEDYGNGTARAPYGKTNMSMSTVRPSADDEVEEETSANMQSSEQEVRLHLDRNAEPLDVSNDKEEPLIMGNSSGQYDVDEAFEKFSFDGDVESVSLRTQSSRTPFRRRISTESTSETSIMSPVAYNDSSGKLTTPRKLKWPSSISEEWDLDPNDYEMASPLASAKLPSLNENRGPSSRVSRKVNWSEDSESRSELGWKASSLEDLNLHSPKPSFNMEDMTKMDATEVTQPSPRKSYYGVSKRSVRSSRSQQNHGVPSPSSSNEGIRSP